MLGTVVSYVPPFSNITKTSIISKTSKSRSPRINLSSPKYWLYMAAGLKNTRYPELSKEEDPSLGELMEKTFPRSTIHNAVKRLGYKAITLENTFTLF